MDIVIDLTNDSDEGSVSARDKNVRGTQIDPIILETEEDTQNRRRTVRLPSGDVIRVISSETSGSRRHRDPQKLPPQAPEPNVEPRFTGTERAVDGSHSLKRKRRSSSEKSQPTPSVEDEMAKLPPLEPRVNGAGFEYPAPPPNGIAIPSKDHHSNNREFLHGLPYAGDGSPRFYGPPPPTNPYFTQFYPPPSGPPRIAETKYTPTATRFLSSQSPSVHSPERLGQARVSEAVSSPSGCLSEPMQWRNKSLTPAPVKVEPSRPSLDLSPAVLPPIELSESAFTLVLQKFQQIVRDEHDYNVKTLLARAPGTQGGSSQPSSIVSKSPKSLASPMMQSKSPFAGMKIVSFERPKLESRKRSIGKFAHYVVKTNKPGPTRTYALEVYHDTTPVLPVYANYTSLKHNMLVEDDNHRTFYTSFGDDPDDDSDSDVRVSTGDGDIKDQEDIIAQNQKVWHKLNSMTERARPYADIVDDLLAELGCDAESVLRYLVDDLKDVPHDLPKELVSVWKSRDQYLTKEGFYEDEEKLSKQPQKRWAASLERLPQASKTEDRKRAAAGLAFVYFSKLVGLSFWHVIRVAHLSQDLGAGGSRIAAEGQGAELKIPEDRSTFSFLTYSDLACLACKAHECPGHGEWEDIRTRYNLEQAARNISEREVLPDGEATPGARHVGPSSTLLGLNDDSTIDGVELEYVKDNNSTLPDDKCCSESCFWRKRNRTTSRGEEKSSWSKEESQIFDMLYPAYYADRRGACLLAETKVFNKSCAAIFERMVLKGPAVTPTQSVNRRKAGEMRTVHRKPHGYWQENFGATSTLHTRIPFVPCNHAGPCSEATYCPCATAKVTCEKACNCSDDCQRRYPGCSCHSRSVKKLCQTNGCECYRLNRECDPDLCHGCHAHEVLDPVNRYNEGILEGKCHNVMVQRAVPKRTLIGGSKLLHDGGKHGFGLYIGEACSKGDFIGEYVGELVSDSEAGRRGAVYDKIEMSYLFDLNAEQTLDSMVFGNKMRFINDQDERQANIGARVVLCNMVTRIGMFAKRDIPVGDELFFDYGSGFRKRFDLIKRNDAGEAVIEKRKKLKSNPKQRKAKFKLKSPAYSKNGRRIGRPPKNLSQQSHLQSTAAPSTIPNSSTPLDSQTATSIPFRGTSRKRRRSISSLDSASVPAVLLPEPEPASDAEIEVDDSPPEDLDDGTASPASPGSPGSNFTASAEEEDDDDDDDGSDDDASDYDPHRSASESLRATPLEPARPARGTTNGSISNRRRSEIEWRVPQARKSIMAAAPPTPPGMTPAELRRWHRGERPHWRDGSKVLASELWGNDAREWKRGERGNGKKKAGAEGGDWYIP